MNVTTIAPLQTPSKPRTRALDGQTLVGAALTDDSIAIRQWALGMGVPMGTAAAFFGIGLATGNENWIGPAVVLGPILMMFIVIYLCLTSDTNGTAR